LKAKVLVILMFSVCLLAVGCRSDKAPTPPLASPVTGSNVGRKMPSFTAYDQFGREVSSDSLKSSNGTVLLFFRSADW
jgi:hypothetical protein